MRLDDKDISFINQAIVEAEAAAARGDYGVGCVIVIHNEIISRAGNEVLSLGMRPWAHAEMLALRSLERTELDQLEQYRQMTIYTTLAPCPQCWGAILIRGIGRVVIGARDPPAEPDYFAVPEILKPIAPTIFIFKDSVSDQCAAIFVKTKEKLDKMQGL